MANSDLVAIVNVIADGQEILVKCEGALDLHNCQKFHDALIEASGQADEVAVDFTNVDYIDTAVLADLAIAANKMRARGKRLKVKVAERSHPNRTLKITGFYGVMDVLVCPKD